MALSPFSVHVEPQAGGVSVVAEGEIDLVSVQRLKDALRDAGVQAVVVLDLRAVTFMDSSGLGAIVGENARAKDAGHRFAVAVRPGSPIQRILELSGLAPVLEVIDRPSDVLGD